MTASNQGLPSDDIQFREPEPVRMAGSPPIAAAPGPLNSDAVDAIAAFIVLRRRFERVMKAAMEKADAIEPRVT